MSAANYSHNSRLFLFIPALCLLIAHQVRSVLNAHQLPQLITLPQLSGYHRLPPPQQQQQQQHGESRGVKLLSNDSIPVIHAEGAERVLTPTAVTIASSTVELPSSTTEIPGSIASDSNATNEGLPWRIAAPNVDTDIPPWMDVYVKFHDQSLKDAHQRTAETDQNKYIVFTCHKSCSGTGNRQRAIMATFMVAVVTKRVFLIDVTHPVRLDSILEPHLVRWNDIPPHLNSLKKTKQLKLRNKNPPLLDSPSKFVAMADQQVIRIEANSPINLERQWKTAEIKNLMNEYSLQRPYAVPANLNKQIFWTLYRPTPALTERAVALRKELGVASATSKYIVLHARTGGGGKGWKDDDRFTTDKPANLYGNAKMVRHSMLKGRHAGNETFPIIVVSDDPKAKEEIFAMDPTAIRYANTKIIHVDRSKRKDNNLEGSIAVWADILVMAEATCIVKGRGSFSMLGVWLAAKSTFGSVCMQLVI